jgi:hypothetical protein
MPSVTDKVIRTIQAQKGDTVRIRWFLPDEGGYYDEVYTCPPLDVRKARNDIRRISDESGEDSSKETT